MTCREKLKIEHPEDADAGLKGGCWGCPHDYGYTTDAPDYCSADRELDGEDVPDTEYNNLCAKCWDREIQEEKEEAIDQLQQRVYDTAGLKPSIIKDSGDRTEFSTGAVRDMHEGKGRCDLMPLGVVGAYYTFFEGTTRIREVLEDIENFQKTSETDYLLAALFKSAIFPKPETMFLEVAKHFEEGAKKYGEYNWQKGIPVNCYIDSAVRHYLKHLRGDTDERHDRAFVWNILCCIWTVENKPELNNYRKEGE